MTFCWAENAIFVCFCVVTGSDFPVIRAYLWPPIPEPEATHMAKAVPTNSARLMVIQFLAVPRSLLIPRSKSARVMAADAIIVTAPQSDGGFGSHQSRHHSRPGQLPSTHTLSASV
jgi:hypothetical protein